MKKYLAVTICALSVAAVVTACSAGDKNDSDYKQGKYEENAVSSVNEPVTSRQETRKESSERRENSSSRRDESSDRRDDSKGLMSRVEDGVDDAIDGGKDIIDDTLDTGKDIVDDVID